MGAVFIICSETKDYYSFMGNVKSNVKGRGRYTEGRWKVCDSEFIFILSSLCTNAPKPFLILIGSDRIDAKSALRHICCLNLCLDFLGRLMNFIQVVGSPSCLFHVIVPDEIRKNPLNAWKCRSYFPSLRGWDYKQRMWIICVVAPPKHYLR